MPAYNGEEFIEQAIQSVLKQSFDNWELIVVDDGSTDNTLHLVESFAKTDSRIRIISQCNSGKPSIARNKGIENAKGELICFLDADDSLEEKKLELANLFFATHVNVNLWFSDFNTMGEDSSRIDSGYLTKRHFDAKSKSYLQPYQPNIFNTDFIEFMILHSTAINTITLVVRTQYLKQHQYFDEQLTVGEDLDLWFRLVLGQSVGYESKALSNYRINPHSITKQDQKMLEGTFQTHYKNLTRIEGKVTTDAVKQYKSKVAEYAKNLAYFYKNHFQMDRSVALNITAFKLSPSIKHGFMLLKSVVLYVFLAFKKPKESP
jgi:glycosyltransferase involved in cell wall biosynthesis